MNHGFARSTDILSRSLLAMLFAVLPAAAQAPSNGSNKTAATKVKADNDAVHNGAEQFFQWLAVDPVDGSVNVVFYDRRNDPKNRLSKP